MTKVDTELFNLCREVCEATGWNMPKSSRNRWLLDRESYIAQVQIKPKAPAEYKVAPLYTSDYLLEKLPKKISVDDPVVREAFLEMRIIRDKLCQFSYESYYYTHWQTHLYEEAKTPLLALLKLTLKLKEEGII